MFEMNDVFAHWFVSCYDKNKNESLPLCGVDDDDGAVDDDDNRSVFSACRPGPASEFSSLAPNLEIQR